MSPVLVLLLLFSSTSDCTRIGIVFCRIAPVIAFDNAEVPIPPTGGEFEHYLIFGHSARAKQNFASFFLCVQIVNALVVFCLPNRLL